MNNFFYRLKTGFRRFMMGRYGTDKLNMTILIAGLIFSLVAMFNPFAMLDLGLTLVSYGLMFWAIFRCLSRNTYKRYQENRKYLVFRLGGWAPRVLTGFHVSADTLDTANFSLRVAYKTFTSSGWLSQTIRLQIENVHRGPYPNVIANTGLASSAFARHY